jgi:hypothetical protein
VCDRVLEVSLIESVEVGPEGVFKVGNRGNVEGGQQRKCSSWTTEGLLKLGQRGCLR